MCEIKSDCRHFLSANWPGVEIECGDGKRRRAKPGVCGLAHGPSVGLLEALGNAIVWPIAARIIDAVKQAENFSLKP